MDERDAAATPMSSFTHLRSIMQLEDGIKAWLSHYPVHKIHCVDLGVREIIHNSEFWSDGKDLLEVVTPLMGIIDLVDSLVPTAGYLQVAVDKAKHTLKPYYDREVSKYERVWQCLDQELNSRPRLYQPTFLLDHSTVATISKALNLLWSRNCSTRELVGGYKYGVVNNSLDMATTFQVPSFNGDLSTDTNKGSEQDTTDVLVRLLMNWNIPVDIVKDPHFRTLLMRVAQHGFPSCLLRDDSVGIRKSVWNFEHEVDEYMLMVKESWKTNGCTLIPYNLNEGRGKPSTLKTDNVVFGFYCLKGFIFVEGRQLDFSQGTEHAFKNHTLNLPLEDVTYQIYHSGHPWCEFVQEFKLGCEGRHCVQQQVQRLWMTICREIEWVHSIIQKSEKVYQYMLNSDESYRCVVWRKLVSEQDADATPRSSFTRLGSIMQLKDWLSDYPEYGEIGVREIINSNEFWSDGKELLEGLTPLRRIIDHVDALVPTSGYLKGVVDKAKRTLEPYYDREVSKYQMIWEDLDGLTPYQDFAAYLSPMYDWRAIEGSLDPVGLIESLDFCFMDEEDEEEEEKLFDEFEVYRYNNPFANLSPSERKWTNPVELWNKHGAGFPLLKKCAIKMLSQPASCMCNQVKKQMLHCQGTDNFILRLNYQMMQEFTKLGDGVYKPLGS